MQLLLLHREQTILPAPTQRILDLQMKNTDTHSCSISTCLFGIIAGCYLSPAQRTMALSILLPPYLSTCPQLDLLSYIESQLNTPNCPPVWPLHSRSHIAGHLFSLRSISNSLPLSSPVPISCLWGTGSPAYSFHLTIGPWLLYDRSRTNWKTRLQHQNHPYSSGHVYCLFVFVFYQLIN